MESFVSFWFICERCLGAIQNPHGTWRGGGIGQISTKFHKGEGGCWIFPRGTRVLTFRSCFLFCFSWGSVFPSKMILRLQVCIVWKSRSWIRLEIAQACLQKVNKQFFKNMLHRWSLGFEDGWQPVFAHFFHGLGNFPSSPFSVGWDGNGSRGVAMGNGRKMGEIFENWMGTRILQRL